MKAISLIILLLFPLYISAQDINPDSAFVDTVQEWHLKDYEWYKERMKIASVKAIKDICDDYAQSTYNSLNKIKENLIECLRLGKKDPYLFNYDDEITNSFGDYKKANNELVTNLKAYNLELKRNLTFVRNYKSKIKTKRLVDAALIVIQDADILGLDAESCNISLIYIISRMNLNGLY